MTEAPYATPPARAPEALGPAVEIVSAGNEVLSGDVLDTNSNWLSRRITGLGGHVRRTVMLRDEVDTIAQELRAAHARRPALIFTVGGLGPTTDDLTLAAVAQAFGRPLELHPEAEGMVRERYEEFAARELVPFAGMNPARLKMAHLPHGSAPLLNRIGGAPGVLLEIDGVAIVSLPGVPAELLPPHSVHLCSVCKSLSAEIQILGEPWPSAQSIPYLCRAFRTIQPIWQDLYMEEPGAPWRGNRCSILISCFKRMRMPSGMA